MKNILLFCITLLLAGCSILVPTKQKFPEANEQLMQKCSKLQTIDKESVTLSELMTTVVKNYSKYHECADLVEAWQEWYTKQKQINQEVNR